MSKFLHMYTKSRGPEEIQKVCEEYANIFPSYLPKGLAQKRLGYEFKIDLEPNIKPVHRPIYKLSPLKLDEAKKQIEYMLEHFFIRPSESPWGAQVLFAPKKDRGLRFCIDYYWLNKKTIRNQYPLPLPEEMMDRLGGAWVFSKMDFKSGYWQVPIHEEDIPMTIFRKRWGLFEFLVMPYGVTNAPSQFMYLVQDILHRYLNVFVVVFIDDILVYSRNTEEHVEHLRLIFERLRKHQLFAKASKWTLYINKVEFLGQWIMLKGATPIVEKLHAVCDWEPPNSVKDVRSFLGFANYYRWFVPRYAGIASPLTLLTKKNIEWHWGVVQRRAFSELKSDLCNPPFLILLDPKLPYPVVIDASVDTTEGVLMQD